MKTLSKKIKNKTIQTVLEEYIILLTEKIKDKNANADSDLEFIKTTAPELFDKTVFFIETYKSLSKRNEQLDKLLNQKKIDLQNLQNENTDLQEKLKIIETNAIKNLDDANISKTKFLEFQNKTKQVLEKLNNILHRIITNAETLKLKNEELELSKKKSIQKTLIKINLLYSDIEKFSQNIKITVKKIAQLIEHLELISLNASIESAKLSIATGEDAFTVISEEMQTMSKLCFEELETLNRAIEDNNATIKSIDFKTIDDTKTKIENILFAQKNADDYDFYRSILNDLIEMNQTINSI